MAKRKFKYKIKLTEIIDRMHSTDNYKFPCLFKPLPFVKLWFTRKKDKATILLCLLIHITLANLINSITNGPWLELCHWSSMMNSEVLAHRDFNFFLYLAKCININYYPIFHTGMADFVFIWISFLCFIFYLF